MNKKQSKTEKILIVDYIASIRIVLRKKLTDEGYECVEASNGNEALAKLSKQRFELVLLDIMMPGKTGREVLPEIVKKYPDTAVIMATSLDDTELAIEMMRMGAYDYVIKPVRLDELPIRVRKALERRSLFIKNREYELSLQKKSGRRPDRFAKLFKIPSNHWPTR